MAGKECGLSEEMQARVLAYLGTVDKAKNRDIANALGAPKHDVDLAVAELAKSDRIEYLYLGTSYVALKGKAG